MEKLGMDSSASSSKDKTSLLSGNGTRKLI